MELQREVRGWTSETIREIVSRHAWARAQVRQHLFLRAATRKGKHLVLDRPQAI